MEHDGTDPIIDSEPSFYNSLIDRAGLSISDVAFLDKIYDAMPDVLSIALSSEDPIVFESAFEKLAGISDLERDELLTILDSLRSASDSSSDFSPQVSFVLDDLVFSITDSASRRISFIGFRGSSDHVRLPKAVLYGGCNYRLTAIAPYAFSGLSFIRSVSIPDSVASIGYRAFNGCSGLLTITIPSSVRSIGFRAFEGCLSLSRIDVDPSNDSYCSDGLGILYRRDP